MDYYRSDVDRSVYPADPIVLPPVRSVVPDAWWSEEDLRRSLASRVIVEDAGGNVAPEDLLNSRTPHKDSHWFWTGYSERGYGIVRVRRKRRKVSRVLWTLCRKGSPDTRRVVHRTCDAEGCVNPFHAELVWNGRWPKGEAWKAVVEANRKKASTTVEA